MLRIAARIILLIILVLTTDWQLQPAPSLAAPSQKASSATDDSQAPVMLDGKQLFMVQERVYSFSPAERAKRISAKLARLLRDPLFSASSITTSDGATTTDILAGDLIIMSVTDRDAWAEGRPRQETASLFAQQMRTALEAHVREYSLHSIMIGVLYSLLTTLALIIILIAFRRLFPRLYTKIDSLRGTRIRSIRIQSFEILHEDRIAAIMISILRGVRVVLTLALFYFYVPIIFSFFPWTRGYAAKLLHYLYTPIVSLGQAIANYLPNLFFIVVIAVVTHFVNRFSRLLFAEIGKVAITIPGFYADWAEPTYKIVRFLIISFALIAAFPYLPGSESPAFKGVSIFFGVLVSLGSTSAVANIISGVILTYTRAFKIGDRVKISDTVGDVTEKTLLVTRIRTSKNADITIPNAMVLGSHITNFSSSARDYGLILHTSVTIGYDAPWRTVHELLIAAALKTENILELPAPFVLQTALNDFYVTYELNAYTDTPQKMVRIYSELHQNIQDRFNEAGVEIMSPHYAQIRDGNRTTIPDAYLDAGYEPGGIRIYSDKRKSHAVEKDGN